MFKAKFLQQPAIIINKEKLIIVMMQLYTHAKNLR